MKERIVDTPTRIAALSLLLICLGTQTVAALTIAGRVVDEEGDPISGVKVSISWFDSPTHAMGDECMTDADGHWQISLPADVDDVSIHLTRSGYISDKSSPKKLSLRSEDRP